MKVSLLLLGLLVIGVAADSSSSSSEETAGRQRRSLAGAVIKAKNKLANKFSTKATSTQNSVIHVKAPPVLKILAPAKPVVVAAPAKVVKQVPVVQHVKVVPQHHYVHKVHHYVPHVCHQPSLYSLFSPTQVTYFEGGIPETYLEVVPMSSVAWSIPVDDVYGQVIDYITIGEGINFVNQHVNGVTQLVVPCVDASTGLDTFVHLGGSNGHLVLVEAAVNGQVIQAFQGFDRYGEVVLPVMYQGSKMVAQRTAYRVKTVTKTHHYAKSFLSNCLFKTLG